MLRNAIGVACLLGSSLALGAPQRVLFVGNSYTAFNGPDSLEVSYARIHQERHPEDTQAVFRKFTIGGASLSRHLDAAKTGELKALLEEGWDLVVLQDQSQIPGFPQSNLQWVESRDAVVELAGLVEAVGAKTRLFVTWGREQGDAMHADRYPNYSTMQDLLTQGYSAYAESILQAGHEAELVPVGEAWRHIHDRVLAETGDPAAGDTLFARLYKNDGSHPSSLGTYLAALTFYASLTGESPVGVKWAHAGIAQEDKAALQAAAASLLPEQEEPGDSEESSESRDTVDSDASGDEASEGCACAASQSKSPGPTLLLLAAVGWIRRKRA